MSSIREAFLIMISVFIEAAAKVREKLAFKFNNLLVALLLSGSFHIVGCGAENFTGEVDKITTRPSIAIYNRDLFESSILQLLIELTEPRISNLKLLYDKSNAEEAYVISKKFSVEMSGVMTFRFNNHSDADLNTIIRSGMQETSLVTLCSFQNVLHIFGKIRADRIESHLVNWILIFKREEARHKSPSVLQSLIFEGTHVTLITQEMNELFLLYSANVQEDGVMRFYYKGQWTSNYEGKRPQLMPLYDPKQYLDMKGRQLYVAANHDPPYVELGEANAGESIQMVGGIDFMILESLKRSLNFTYKVFSPPDGGWGYPQPDGTVTGMIGMVARREVHVAVTGIAMNAARSSVIDYTRPYAYGFMCIYSRALSEKSIELAIFSPFSLEVWLCIIVCTSAIGPVLKVHSKLSEELGIQKDTYDIQTYSFNMYRNLVIQGSLLVSTTWSQRIILFFWYIFCLIIWALYSGTLTAVLAVPAYEKPIDSLEDFPTAVKNGYTLTVVGDSSNEYMFKDATDGILKQTWQLFNHKDRTKSFLKTSEDGMRLILDEKSIHIVPCLNGRILTVQMGKHNFYLGRGLFYPQNDAFAIPQGSPYKKAFDDVIRKITGAGLVTKWDEDEINKMAKSNTQESEGSKSFVITLVHLQAAFFLLLLGFSISTSALIAEAFVWMLFSKEGN